MKNELNNCQNGNIRLQKRLKTLKSKFSISDGVEIHYKWKEDWRKYFEEQSKAGDAS